MRAKELTAFLARMVGIKRPVLVKGAPGVGKSDIVLQAAKIAKADAMILHPVVSDPTDFKGLPGIVDGAAEWLPYGELRKMMTAKRLTVVFLDDLGQAPAVVQAACMQLLLAREINGKRISDHITFVAATNRREDRAGVTGILEPVKSRFASIVELTVNVDDWCDWAMEHDVPVELVAFIRFRPELLMDGGQPTQDIVNRPCPRTVFFCGELLRVGIKEQEALAGAVGSGFAAELLGFLRIWEQLPSVDSILVNPGAAGIPREPAAQYAITAALVGKVSRDNAGRVMQYATRLPKEFTAMLVRDALRRTPAIAQNKAFIQWATANQDLLV